MSERRLAAVMVSPSLLLIALVAAYPIGYAVWLSLNEYSIRVAGLSRWAGLRNYENALRTQGFVTIVAGRVAQYPGLPTDGANAAFGVFRLERNGAGRPRRAVRLSSVRT